MGGWQVQDDSRPMFNIAIELMGNVVALHMVRIDDAARRESSMPIPEGLPFQPNKGTALYF